MIDSTKKIEIKTTDEIARMRKSGILLRRIMDTVFSQVVPGVTTYDLDQTARRLIREAGAIPAFLGYHGFPATLCTSVNEEIVHGIPGPRILNEGDIISIDCGLSYQGYYADTAFTAAVGSISPEASHLLEVTQRSLEAGIEKMRVGNRIGDVSNAIQRVIEAHGFGIVRDYTGHGIGRAMHEPPQVLNFGDPGSGVRLKPGIVLAIEPMVNIGTHKTQTLADGWTVITADKSLSAHFEHTVAVTENGPYVLTAAETTVPV